jgi:integrase
VTFSAFAAEWISNQLWRPSTAVRVEAIVTNHLEPRFGSRAMASVTPSQAMIKSLSETMAPGTIRGVHSVLSAIYRTAVRDRVVAQSPCTDDIRLPESAQRLVEPLTLDQVEAVADAVGSLYRPLVVLGAGAGLRVGEALGMPGGGIDFPRRQLSVTQQSVTVRRVTTIAEPKTKTSVRTIPLADAVLAELASHLEGRQSRPDDLLVADKDGSPIPQNRFSQTWARAVKRAGLPAGTRFHDLRHTYASALIASGCSVKVVQAHLGHRSAAVTLDTYSHLRPTDDDRTRTAVDAFFRGAVSPVCHDEATG